VCSFQFGIDVVLPNLYNDRPVSAIVVRIEALWNILYGMFCFLHSRISCIWVVAERESPYTKSATWDSFASSKIDSSSTFFLSSS